jgi:serine/threonine protein phosphatase PrpC
VFFPYSHCGLCVLVLHELHDGRGNEILLAGIFDGHGGTAASTTVSRTLPGVFASEIASFSSSGKANDDEIKKALSLAWTSTCDAYRYGCDEEEGECIAEYDPIHGIVRAGTGSKDMVAGTTGVAAVVSVADDGGEVLSLLNCGDSRAVLVGKPRIKDNDSEISRKQTQPSYVHFYTQDHSPEDPLEYERLQRGKDAGLDYSLPQCSYSRWWLKVGDYRYAVSRSLEGTFATNKGITSDADVVTISLPDVLAERDDVCLILASDGLYEVMDNEEIAMRLTSLRETGFSAGDAAKNLAAQAVKKGSSDNVSCVVIYFS